MQALAALVQFRLLLRSFGVVRNHEGRQGVVVTFLAILELCKEATIDIVQAEPFAPIYLKPRSESVDPVNDSTEHIELPE